VVSIFARNLSDKNLASLVKKIDETVGKNEDKKMAAFVVVLAEDADAAAPKLETLAKEQGIKNVPLTIFDGEAGPADYKIAKDADVTVLLWTGQNVKANHAFKAGELNDKAIEGVVADTAVILK
jgi:predicted TIM-barrel fold metal-dependent hydrolase